jgi:putative PEP-CTERM system histidine kinase
MLASGSVQARIRDFVNRNFFSYRYDYRQEWLRFISVFSDSLTEMRIPERIVRGLANIVESTGGAAWVLREEDDAYHRVAAWNMGDELLPSLSVNDPFVRYLAEERCLIDVRRRAIAGREDADGELPLPVWLMENSRAWLVLPLIHTAGLPGFVVLARPRAARTLDWEAIELLTTAGQQAASYIAEDNAARSLIRARRFEDFNRQFAFVVHDIKNLTGQMTLILKNAERHGNNPEFQRDVLATGRESVQRMTQLLDQLRANRPTPVAANAAAPTVDMKALIERMAEDWRLQTPHLRLETPAAPVRVNARSDRLVAVLNHLIQNAVEAAGARGHVSLSLAARSGLTEGGNRDDEMPAPQWAEIVVADDGPGMDAAFVAERLFQPLDSTKSAGFGIGAYQCREQVREMGGRLLVDSAPGRGTRMIVRLPLIVSRIAAQVDAPASQGIYRHG